MDVALSEPFRNGEGNVPAETIPAEVRARPPGVPAGALVRKRISAQTRTARARAMTAATARHADARLTPSPAKVATCLGTSHASGSPTRPEDDSSSPASPDTPEAFPRARANPADAPGASAAPEDAERLFLPGEARNGSRSSRASAGSDAKRHPSFKKTHWVKDKDAKACGHKPCSRPFTVLLRRHHCRACGLVFCARCVETRLLLDPQTAEPVTSRVAAAAGAGVPRAYAYAATNAPSRRPRRRRSAKARVKARAWRRWRRKRRKRLLLPTSRNTGTQRFRYRKRLRSEARRRARAKAFLSAPFSRKKHPTPKEKKRAFRRRLRARKRPTPRKKASAARSLQAVGR